MIIELAVDLYCRFGSRASIYYLELAAVPFQMLFTLGFGLVAWLSLRHAWMARRLAARENTPDVEQPALFAENVGVS